MQRKTLVLPQPTCIETGFRGSDISLLTITCAARGHATRPPCVRIQVPEGAQVLVRRYDSGGRIVGDPVALVTEDDLYAAPP